MRLQNSLLAAFFASWAVGIALPAPPLLSPPSPLGGLTPTPLSPLTPLTPLPNATPNAGGPLPSITGLPSPSTPDASFPTLNVAQENGVFPGPGTSGTGTGTGFPMPPPTGGPMLRRRSKPVRRVV